LDLFSLGKDDTILFSLGRGGKILFSLGRRGKILKILLFDFFFPEKEGRDKRQQLARASLLPLLVQNSLTWSTR